MRTSPIYLHLRRIKRDMRFPIQAKGGLTIKLYPPDTSGYIKVAVAECSPKDHYNKRIGREKCDGRASSKKKWRMFTVDTLIRYIWKLQQGSNKCLPRYVDLTGSGYLDADFISDIFFKTHEKLKRNSTPALLANPASPLL